VRVWVAYPDRNSHGLGNWVVVVVGSTVVVVAWSLSLSCSLCERSLKRSVLSLFLRYLSDLCTYLIRSVFRSVPIVLLLG